jgi:integrase
MMRIEEVKTESGKARYRIEFTEPTGARRRIKFKTRAEAEAELTRKKGAILDNTYIDPKRVPTLEALSSSWLAGRIELSRTPGRGYRPSTLAAWQAQIEHHVKPLLGSFPVNQICAEAIERAMAKWQAPKPDGHGLSPHTVSKVLTTLTRIFKAGIKSRFLTTDPVSLVERVKTDSGEQSEAGERFKAHLEIGVRAVLTPEEVKRVIMAAKPGLYRAIITTAIYTGARHGELLALRWTDVDFAGSAIQIRRNISMARVKGEANQEKYRWFDPKTKNGTREVPLPGELAAALKTWKGKCPAGSLGLVFPNPLGEPCHRSNVLRFGLYPALKQAAIEKDISMHSLRHTYASMLIALKRPITEVSGYLGHADVSITMRVYAHFLKTKKQDTMGDLERLIQNG